MMARGVLMSLPDVEECGGVDRDADLLLDLSVGLFDGFPGGEVPADGGIEGAWPGVLGASSLVHEQVGRRGEPVDPDVNRPVPVAIAMDIGAALDDSGRPARGGDDIK